MDDKEQTINKLLGTDPSEVMRMGRLEARKFFRALVNEANERLAVLEDKNLTMSDAYIEVIDHLRKIKGKRRFSVPTDERLQDSRVWFPLLGMLRGFLQNPSSKPREAKYQKDQLKKLFGAITTEERKRQAWEVIDFLRNEFPERFSPSDSDKLIKSILHKIVDQGYSPLDVEHGYRDRWLKEYARLREEDEAFMKAQQERVDWLREKYINNPEYESFFNFDGPFDYETRKIKNPFRRGGFYEI